MTPPRLLIPALVISLALLAGCGSSDGDDESQTTTSPAPASSGEGPPGASAQGCPSPAGNIGELRVVDLDCDTAKAVAADWNRMPGCSAPAGASRYSCTVQGLRCLGASTERGIAVSCAGPGRSVSFVRR